MIFGTPPIVTNGLVLHLDAGSRQSYVSGSTTWRDLSGNTALSASLVNGPTFDSSFQGSILFDGSNDYAEVPNNAALNSLSGTISVWHRLSAVNVTTYASLIGKHDAAGSNNGYNIIIYSNGSIAAQIKGIGTTDVAGSPAQTLNVWHNAVLTYSSGTSHTLYVDNILYSSGPCVTISAISTQPLRMVDSVDTFWGIMAGNIANVQIYNRVLSAQEVAQNYNALKSRFGLT